MGTERHDPPGKARKLLEAQLLGYGIFRAGRGHPEAAASAIPSFCSWDVKVSKARDLPQVAQDGSEAEGRGVGQLCLLCLTALLPSFLPSLPQSGQVSKEGTKRR